MIYGINNIRRRVEEAVVNYLLATDDPGTVNVYRYRDAAGGESRIAYPCMKVYAKSSRPMSDDLDATSGATNRYVSIEVRCFCPPVDADDGQTARDRIDELAGRVLDALHVDGLASALNTAAPEGVSIEQVNLPNEEDGEDGEVVITFDLLAHGKAT